MSFHNKDPFPDKFLTHQYPVDAKVTRPRLAPDLEKEFYCTDIDRLDLNALPWQVVYNLNNILPCAELIGFALYLMKKMPELNLQERTRDPADPMLQPPELMQGYLKLLIEKTGQRTLRRRWGDKFNRILDYYNFLTYRIQMRTTACARLKEELKAQRDDQLNQNTGHGTASLLLPAHLR